MKQRLSQLIASFGGSVDIATAPRPYINHAVEFKRVCTTSERVQALEAVGLNVFYYPSEMVDGCDFLSDSGTTTMTNEQWASLHMGDEAYGSNRGYFLLVEKIGQLFGEGFAHITSDSGPGVFLFHQGRAAENAFFGELSKVAPNSLVPSNGHFDTTAANIEAHGMEYRNLFSPALYMAGSTDNFKGNMDVDKLKTILAKERKRVPVIFLTITNNTGGGQPVSMENIRQVSEVAHSYDIPLFFDACRFAENAYFIKCNEKGFAGRPIETIIKKMFSYADGFTISFKKDGLANMGGGLFLRKGGLFMKKYPSLPDAIMNRQILAEGHPTYGGMSGRDIMSLVVGLGVVVSERYLEHRISQVQDFGKEMELHGLPVVMPIGGHAVYLDMNRFFEGTKMKGEDFGGIAFTALLLACFGHRACELGYFAFGRYDKATRKEIYPEVNFVRFAIPRLRYEKQDLDHAVFSAKTLYDNRGLLPRIKVIYGRDLPLRHFKAKFAFV